MMLTLVLYTITGSVDEPESLPGLEVIARLRDLLGAGKLMLLYWYGIEWTLPLLLLVEPLWRSLVPRATPRDSGHHCSMELGNPGLL